jgi:hypothetical protein
MEKPSQPKRPPEDSVVVVLLDRRIVQMRRMLALMKPTTPTDTLKLLRERFPDVPLSERVRALTRPPA